VSFSFFVYFFLHLFVVLQTSSDIVAILSAHVQTKTATFCLQKHAGLPTDSGEWEWEWGEGVACGKGHGPS